MSFGHASNLSDEVGRLLNDIDFAEDNLATNLRRAAIDAVALIAHRIQQKGENASGQRMRTKSRLILGAYSGGYGKKRSERGRQVDHIDFTNDNDLFNSWQVLQTSDRLVTAGFVSDEQADKAEYLEAYFGEAFALSDSEEQIIGDALAESIVNDIDRR